MGHQMALNGTEKWGMRKAGPYSHIALHKLSKNVKGSSIGVTVQKLWLPEVGLLFLDSSNFTLTSNVTSRAFCLGGGCQPAYSRMYS